MINYSCLDMSIHYNVILKQVQEKHIQPFKLSGGYGKQVQKSGFYF